MKKLSLLIAMLVVSMTGFAQWTLSGHIQDNNSNPVINHTVDFMSVPGGWTLSTTTNSNGDYSINIPTTTPPNTLIDIFTTDSLCFVGMTDSVLYNNQQNLVKNFTFCGNTTTNYTVSGQITTGTSGADAAIVYLIEDAIDSNQNHILTALDSVLADTQSGYYSMPLPTSYSGVLKVKAALLSVSSVYANYLPTYYSSSLTWNGTGVQTISGVMNSTANISLIAGTNPGGPAFIGGDVMQGANKSTAVGDPLANRILILTDAGNQAVAYTYSDANGNFSFPSLAYGTYHLFGDAMGKYNPQLTFTLDANHPSITTINFWENDEEFVGYLWPLSVATSAAMSNVTVYPNPATDVVNIKGLDAIKGTKAVTISSINGAVVFSSSYQQNDKVSIPVSELSSGFYMLQVATEEGSSIYKIVK